MRFIVKNKALTDKSFSFKDIIGKRVLSKNGIIIGNIKNVIFDNKSLEITGIVVGKNFRKILIGSEYFNRITKESLILNMDPAILLKNKRVLSADGKFLGKVKQIITNGDSNKINSIIVRSKFYFRKREIPSEDIKSIENSIILRNNYDTKKHFWQGNK